MMKTVGNDSAVTITFDRGWNENSSGALVAGEQLRVAYDADRLRTCRASTHGSEAWGVTGFAKFDGADVVSLLGRVWLRLVTVAFAYFITG